MTKISFLVANVSLMAMFLILTFSAQAQFKQLDPFSQYNQLPTASIYGLPTSRSAYHLKPKQSQWSLLGSVANTFTTSQSSLERITLDNESLLIQASLRYAINNRWQLGVELPWVNHSGGAFDAFIENWHNFFGLPNGGREFSPQDILNISYTKNGVNLIDIDNSQQGISDIRLQADWLISTSEKHSLSLQSQLKLPTGDSSALTGSGATDISLALAYQRPTNNYHLSWQVSGGLLWITDSDILAEQLNNVIWTSSATMGWNWTKWLQFKMQIDIHSAIYESDLRELGDASGQLTFGFDVKPSPKLAIELSLSEDVFIERSPDVVFRLGFRYNAF